MSQGFKKLKEEILTIYKLAKGEMMVMVFPLIFVYLEIVLALSTRGSFTGSSLIYITLFSMAYGLGVYLVSSLCTKEIINKIIAGIVLFVICTGYTMVYLLFCEFQLFYDLNTMLAGASDAAGSFSGDIIAIILTPSGFIHVILFFMPLMLYGLSIKKKKVGIHSISWNQRRLIIVLVISLVLGNIIGIYSDPNVRSSYGESFEYTAAVRNFGLMTGLRLEVENRWYKEEEVAFESVEVTRDRIGHRVEKEAVVSYGKNQLAIDFEALAEKDNGAYKDLDEYVASQQASSQNEYTGLFKGKNLIFITAEAFTAEAIDRKRTPTLYRLANKGIQFLDYYQPTSAGTTGGEYANIFGMLPTYGGASMKMTSNQLNWTTIASRLNDEGYYGKAYHNNDYTYYDRDKTHINLGYSDGFEGIGNGMEEYVAYSEWPESDLEMVQGTLDDYINKQPFNIYYMSVSGHSLYGEGQNAMAKKNWEYVEDLPYSDNVKGYLGAQMELENALSYLVEELEERGIEDDTVIVIATDHFPYGLDQNSGALTYLSELYGYDVTNNLERDHNRLIIWSGCLEDKKPIKVESPTSSIDILPTLCNLFGVEFDSRLLVGRDVFSDKEALVFTLGYEWKTDLGSFTSSKGFVPVNEEVEIPEGYVERIKALVKNKISYSKAVLQKDYFRHVFGE